MYLLRDETKRLAYLHPEYRRIADWIEEWAAKASGVNVVALRREARRVAGSRC